MATVSGLAPVIRIVDQGDKRWFSGGGVHTWKATAEETGGAFFLFEDSMEQGKMTPLHTHPDSDETMYVLEGEILMHMDGTEHRIATGGLAVAPRGVPHAFMVLAAGTRLLCLHTPGACQAFYLDASEPITAERPASGEVDFARVQESAKRNGGIVLLGPPPFAHP
jgi:quercetin dioxygenase-like cupin family protein